jgi:polysaccharide deacetylase family protein (PEP-CTERM system associated)
MVRGSDARTLNALTVDVEDWAHSYLDYNLPVAPEVLDNTKRVLDLMGGLGAKATFFCLGMVAQKYPQLIRDIAEAGHELGVHGWSHKPIWDSSPERLNEELTSAKAEVEDASGQEARGFRAPRFSIIESTSWAFDVVAECGFEYDSSVMPASLPTRGYGIIGVPLHPYRLANGLLEVPLTSLKLLKWRIPAAGGGYMRFWPLAAHRRAIGEQNRSGYPAVVYVHPHEFDPHLKQRISLPMKLTTRIFIDFNRGAQVHRVRSLIKEFRFSSVSDVLKEWDARKL